MHCSWLIVKRVNYLWLPSINVPILNGDLPNVALTLNINFTCIDLHIRIHLHTGYTCIRLPDPRTDSETYRQLEGEYNS